MSPKLLMAVSAAIFWVLGLSCLFLPQELAALAGLDPGSEIVLQLFAGGLIAIGFLNWMGRSAIYGGIYGRPIVVANFGFAFITAGTLFSAWQGGELASWSIILIAVFALLALSFWMLMRSSKPTGDGFSAEKP